MNRLPKTDDLAIAIQISFELYMQNTEMKVLARKGTIYDKYCVKNTAFLGFLKFSYKF